MILGRRADMQRMTPAELSIFKAMQEVEEVGCDPLLTDAVCFLQDARNKLADYIDREIEKKGTNQNEA